MKNRNHQESLPSITIVTPSYNQAPFLETTLLSVLDQGYPNLEYFVFDGGSADGSVDIIRKHADRLAYWESKPDKGQADAIYRGFSRATGTILGYLNSDDTLLPGALEKVGTYFLEHPESECVVGGSIIIDGEGRSATGRWGLPRFAMGTPVSFRSLLYWGCGFHQPASFWKRAAFEQTGGFDPSLQFCFDYDMFLRFARRQTLDRISEFLACFRVHEKSKTSTLQSVCEKENRMLWEKHGRPQRSRLYRMMLHAYYDRQDRIYHRLYQGMAALGKVRLPQRETMPVTAAAEMLPHRQQLS